MLSHYPWSKLVFGRNVLTFYRYKRDFWRKITTYFYAKSRAKDSVEVARGFIRNLLFFEVEGLLLHFDRNWGNLIPEVQQRCLIRRGTTASNLSRSSQFPSFSNSASRPLDSISMLEYFNSWTWLVSNTGEPFSIPRPDRPIYRTMSLFLSLISGFLFDTWWNVSWINGCKSY